MAAFKPHYSLCPLLGPHNLVGVCADKEENTILVTLGPNIIVKQKVVCLNINVNSFYILHF